METSITLRSLIKQQHQRRRQNPSVSKVPFFRVCNKGGRGGGGARLSTNHPSTETKNLSLNSIKRARRKKLQMWTWRRTRRLSRWWTNHVHESQSAWWMGERSVARSVACQHLVMSMHSLACPAQPLSDGPGVGVTELYGRRQGRRHWSSTSKRVGTVAARPD